jgi:HD superfamily phosphohydrolase
MPNLYDVSMTKTTSKSSQYEGVALINDPVHGYISFTVPYPDQPKEITEKDLIDSAWVQRLRYVNQLQSARWVFPTAEHSRFQHSVGAMHVAGRFARHLHPSLKQVISDLPSPAYIEELLRVTALLHDVGHGPFCHFFDDNYLDEYELTHEHIGQRIITQELGEMISKIHRSPHGVFHEGERLDPQQIAFLILKESKKPASGSSHRKSASSGKDYPKWLSFLRPIIGGIYTADNLDYVLRDAYVCGVAIGPVDLDRLMHYTFFTENGLTLHRAGCNALTMFLNARLYLYTNVYYHRTTRAIDLHLREIFRDTVKLIFPHNPLERLDLYLSLTDWSLLETVRRWPGARQEPKKLLGQEWERILRRDVKWKMAYDTTLSIREPGKGQTLIHQEELERSIRDHLPRELKQLEFRVDLATQDPRPLNPLMMGQRQIYVYNPSNKVVSKEALQEFFDYIPARVVHCRVFAKDHTRDEILSEVVEKALLNEGSSIKTNV